LPHTKYALPAYYIVAPAEASSNLARYDGVRYGLRENGRSIGELYENTRAAGFGAEVRRRVMIGTYMLSAGYYDAYYIVAPAEASSNLARYDAVRYGLRVKGRDIIGMYEKTRSEGFGAEVRRRVMIGTYVLSAGYYDAYYLRAQKVRTLIKKDFEDCFKAGVHAMLTPATPCAAFGLGEKGGADPVEMYLNDVFTVTVNMAGLPGIAVPAGLDTQGLPLGLQLIGRPFDEETLFSLAAAIEQAAGSFAPPKWWA
ncbi:MAG TPA: amidase family protein, partial [Pseudolabrys sp.]|nr:amidase family protein [Pseudolabrys sp.]